MAANLLYGIDVFLSTHSTFQHHRLALVTNDAATTAAFENSRLALLKSGCRIIKLFTPEHGLSAQGADGVFQENRRDELTGLPVISLYGDRLSPTADDLSDVDAVLFDIPDIGCRFYTYQWTLSYVMESCARYAKPLIVLDRPNPLGGNLSKAEGPWLHPDCMSFIGRWNMPVTHGCTIGELANYWKAGQKLDLDMQVVKVGNWKAETQPGYFVPTSPGIPDLSTAQLYPGMGFMEGINVSEGRGTTMPFKLLGAPWINAGSFTNEFNSLALPGVKAIPFSFEPAWGKYAGSVCRGMMLAVTDPSALQPVRTGLALIRLLAREYPENLEEQVYPTRANPAGTAHLDKLTGMPGSFTLLTGNNNFFEEQVFSLTSAEAWKGIISDFLLYPRKG